VPGFLAFHSWSLQPLRCTKYSSCILRSLHYLDTSPSSTRRARASCRILLRSTHECHHQLLRAHMVRYPHVPRRNECIDWDRITLLGWDIFVCCNATHATICRCACTCGGAVNCGSRPPPLGPPSSNNMRNVHSCYDRGSRWARTLIQAF